MPYIDIFKVSLTKHLNLDENQHIISTIKPIGSKKTKPKASGISGKPIYSLMFYDGTWQKPVKHTYWIYNDILRANATRYKFI